MIIPATAPPLRPPESVAGVPTVGCNVPARQPCMISTEHSKSATHRHEHDVTT